MVVAVILLSIAGWYYYARIGAADEYARGQCAVFRTEIAQARVLAREKDGKDKKHAAPQEHQSQATHNVAGCQVPVGDICV